MRYLIALFALFALFALLLFTLPALAQDEPLPPASLQDRVCEIISASSHGYGVYLDQRLVLTVQHLFHNEQDHTIRDHCIVDGQPGTLIACGPDAWDDAPGDDANDWALVELLGGQGRDSEIGIQGIQDDQPAYYYHGGSKLYIGVMELQNGVAGFGGDPPWPGYSGTPVFRVGKVVGIITTRWTGGCMGGACYLPQDQPVGWFVTMTPEIVAAIADARQ